MNSIFWLQHANEDVEKMILGNKCDMEDSRVVPRERGDLVSNVFFNCVHKLWHVGSYDYDVSLTYRVYRVLLWVTLDTSFCWCFF